MSIRRLFGIFLLCLPIPGLAQSPEAEVRVFLQTRDRDIKQAVARLEGGTQKERDRAASLINDQIDFAEMGRLALGDYWGDLTDAQRADFVDTFGAIVRGQSLSDLTVYNAVVTIDSIGVSGAKAYVRTHADVEGTALKVEYLLRRKEEAWWLYDIVLDDVGTVEGYAISFQTYIRKRGFERFIASLKKKLPSG